MFSKTYKIVNPTVIEEFLENVEPNENEAIVKIEKLAICKADIRYYLGLRAKEVLDKKYPITPIHEAVGVIIKDPTGKFNKGDRVILVPNLVDESKCSSCLQTRCQDYAIDQNYCPNAKFASSTSDGFLRQYVAYNTNFIVKYDSKIESKYAVFSELLSVANAATRRASNLINSKEIAIWGDGIMAYMVYIILNKVLHHNVTVIGLDENKLELFKDATTMTVEEIKNSSKQFSTIFECVGGKGSESAINAMIDHSSIGAILILMGVSEDLIQINTRKVLEKGICLKGVTRSSVNDFILVSKYIESEEVIEAIKPLILSITTLKDTSDIYGVFDAEIENKKIIGKNIMEF